MALSQAREFITSYVDRFGGRERLNDSLIYGLYVALAYPRHAMVKRMENRFFQSVIPNRPSLIFDIGANHGNKAIIFSKMAGKVICVEPSPASANILRRRFARNPKIVVEEVGIHAADGTATFHVFPESSALSTFSVRWAHEVSKNKGSANTVTVPTVKLETLIQKYGVPDYIKIDIEGLEVEAIRGLATPVPVVSFEANLPTFADETVEAVELLSSLAASYRFNFCTAEPPTTFHQLGFLSKNEITKVIRSGRHEFMEVYGKLKAI